MKLPSIHMFIVLLFFSYDAKSAFNDGHILRNAVYVEIGGIGGIGSINYERIIPIKTKLKIGLRIGFSTNNLTDYTTEFNPDAIFPLSVNVLYGKTHHMELGFGQTISSVTQASESDWQPERVTEQHTNFTLGYRYQKEQGRFIFRCAYTPIIEFNTDYRHWGGISFGYAF